MSCRAGSRRPAGGQSRGSRATARAWLLLLACAAALLPAAAAAQEETDDSSPLAPTLPPPSDTVLPRTGIDPSISDLRQHLLNAYGQNQPSSGPPPPNLQLLAQIGVSEEYIDNVGAITGSGHFAGDDFITLIQPAVQLIDTTQRLEVNLAYRPTEVIYARNGAYTQFEQQFSGDILATLVPEWLYFDVRGFVSQQSVFGGLGPGITVTLAPQDRETTSSVSISPYVDHTFGGTGTAQIGADYTYSATDSPISENSFVGLGETGAAAADFNRSGLAAYGSSYLSTERIFANFTTGEDYGRFRDRIAADVSFYNGSGALADAHRYLFTDDASYAVTRLVAALGQIGYEDLEYPRADYGYDGPIGAAGVQLTPGPHSTVILEYRYVDGFGSPFAEFSVQVSPRIRAFGGYSEGISTFQQDIQNTLLDGDTDATGAPASALIAAPLLVGSNFFGANENLSRLTRLNISATYLGTMDTLTVSMARETTRPIGRPVDDIAQVSTSGIYGNITDVHTLTPTLSLTGFLQYGSNRTGLAYSGSGDVLSVSVGLDKVFTSTLTGYIRYGGNFILGGSVFAAVGYEGLRGNENSITVGAVKRF